MKGSNVVSKLLVAVLWCGVSVGCVADSPFVEAWSSEKPKAVIDNSKQIPLIDLYWKRPANSFVMVQSENDVVCNKFLNAINEERDNVAIGDITREGTVLQQPKTNMYVPELIIQTKLNIPRKNIEKTSPYKGAPRAEEYVVDINQDGVTEYAYRTTGLVSSTPEHGDILISDKSFLLEGSRKPYFDFIHDIRGKEMMPKMHIKFPWISNTVILELVMINDEYYIVCTSFGVKYGAPIEVTLSKIEKDYTTKQQCSIKTVFTVSKH